MTNEAVVSDTNTGDTKADTPSCPESSKAEGRLEPDPAFGLSCRLHPTADQGLRIPWTGVSGKTRRRGRQGILT